VAVPDALARLNQLPAAAAERELLACCAATEWARQVAAARPFDSPERLAVAADAALSGLDWAGVAEALAAHPRLGERPAGTDRAAGWSAGEQSGATGAAAADRAALAAGNAAYERRFGHVYLACATGRSATELLAFLHERLGHDPQTERAVVRAELARITRLRLAKLLAAAEPAGEPAGERR
jgi:2-oxo-4-hydroxy-4-carboxy-5-ureidoimidazoline decarboxylase